MNSGPRVYLLYGLARERRVRRIRFKLDARIVATIAGAPARTCRWRLAVRCARGRKDSGCGLRTWRRRAVFGSGIRRARHRSYYRAIPCPDRRGIRRARRRFPSGGAQNWRRARGSRRERIRRRERDPRRLYRSFRVELAAFDRLDEWRIAKARRTANSGCGGRAAVIMGKDFSIRFASVGHHCRANLA